MSASLDNHQRLSELDRLPVFEKNLYDGAGPRGRYLVHRLHRFHDQERVASLDRATDVNEWLGARLRPSRRGLLGGVVGLIVLGAVASHDAGGQTARPTIATDADFRRAMKELSNWGRWGEKDELGAANLITPAKRKQAIALAKEGISVSLSHDVPQEKAADTPTVLERSLHEMRGNMSLERIPDPAAFERANFRMALR